MTFVFGAQSRIPGKSALPRNWMIEVRDGDRYEVFSRRPTIAGDVIEIVLDATEVPELMRGRFRWHAMSEWGPDPAETSPRVFPDFCPNTGFPRFGGTST